MKHGPASTMPSSKPGDVVYTSPGSNPSPFPPSSGTDYQLWGNNPTNLPGSSTAFGAHGSLATYFKVTTSGITLKGYEWFVVDAGQKQTGVRFCVWTVTGLHTGTVLAGSTVTSGALTIGTTPNLILLGTPVALTSGQVYLAVAGDSGTGPIASNYWGTAGGTGKNGIVNGPLTGYSDTAGNQGTLPEPNGNNQGAFQLTNDDPTLTYPSSAFSSGNFWISPIVHGP